MHKRFGALFPSFVFCLLLLAISLSPAKAGDGVFNGPFALTVVGRTDDYADVMAIFNKAGVSTRANPKLAPEGIEDAKTLVILIGPAANSGADPETARLIDLLTIAKDRGVNVVGIYISGLALRARAQNYINLVMEQCDMFIATRERDNNSDGYFDDMALKHDFHLLLPKQLDDLAGMLPMYFRG